MKKLLIVLAVLFATVAAYASDPVDPPPTGLPGSPVSVSGLVGVDVVCPVTIEASAPLFWRVLQGYNAAPPTGSTKTLVFTIKGCHWGIMSTGDQPAWNGSKMDVTCTVVPYHTYADNAGVEITAAVDYAVGATAAVPTAAADWTTLIAAQELRGQNENGSDILNFKEDYMFLRGTVNNIKVATDAVATPGYYGWTITVAANYNSL